MSFLKTFLASILGTIVGIFFLFFILFASIMSRSGQPEPYIRSNSVLSIEISGDIPARHTADPFRELLQTETGDQVSLDRLKATLDKAASDERISGVWIKINRVTSSWANLETAYGYLNRFREESGKFVYASTDDIGMNESAYFLASAADSVFSPPQTYLEFNGFVIQSSYYRDMLDRIGVEPEILRVGNYKSATEPFLRDDSSPEHREQVTAILNQVSDTFVNGVSARRDLSTDQLHDLMNEIPENDVDWALENRLIDVIAHPQEMEELIRLRLGLEDEDELHTVSFNRYQRVTPSSADYEQPDTDNRIAIIYASGMIIPESIGGSLGSEPVITAAGIQESLESVLENDNVKAIVLHIDSGGGAVSTSELIWGHLRKAAEEKPVIAYMGGVAASGGYYIAMGADQVVASPNTLTGSIGIYSLMFNTQELFNDKLGIHFEEFKTHPHADISLMNRPLTDSERNALQRNIENGYETFLQRVADGRQMSRDQVHELARGRVWTGEDARERNLVDQTGDLDVALGLAAERAGIDEWDTLDYPEQKPLIELLFGTAEAKITSWIQSWIPQNQEIRTLRQLIESDAGRNWAILPVTYRIE